MQCISLVSYLNCQKVLQNIILCKSNVPRLSGIKHQIEIRRIYKIRYVEYIEYKYINYIEELRGIWKISRTSSTPTQIIFLKKVNVFGNSFNFKLFYCLCFKISGLCTLYTSFFTSLLRT